MPVTHLRPSMYRQMPWKNGLGVTTEIARAPLAGDFDWRISVARVVADGPFSLFPGCDRVILALDGAGMILSHPDSATDVTLEKLEPWSFSGDLATNCVLRDGAFRDFNVITRRESFAAAVSVLRPGVPEAVDTAADTTILYCVAGSFSIETTGPFDLQPDETAILDRVTGDSRILVRPSAPETVAIRVDLSGARSVRGR